GEVVHAVRVQIPGVGAEHPLDPVAHDVADLVSVGGIVDGHRGVGRREYGRVPVGVLEAFTGEGGAPRGRVDEEPAGELVTGGPELVPGALESEHRVVDVERDERLAVGGVGRPYRLERRGRTRLVD